jgi:hypothetical protein
VIVEITCDVSARGVGPRRSGATTGVGNTHGRGTDCGRDGKRDWRSSELFHLGNPLDELHE